MSTLETLANKVHSATGRLSARPAGKGTPAGDADEAADAPGPVPFVVVGAALAAGIVLAKWIDRRGRVDQRG